jgi:hypothetical protein
MVKSNTPRKSPSVSRAKRASAPGSVVIEYDKVTGQYSASNAPRPTGTLRPMTVEEGFEIAKKAGILTATGRLTSTYRK